MGGDLLVIIDVKVDLYSDGKEDWQSTEQLRRLRYPIRGVGGDARPGGALGSTFFLASDWKIQPYNSSQRLRINGNFYSEDGTTPFLTVPGENVFLEQELSAIVEVEDAPGGGGAVNNTDTYARNVIYINVSGGTGGTVWPTGTSSDPVNSLADAKILGSTYGITHFRVVGPLTIGNTDNINGLTFEGDNVNSSALTLTAGCTTAQSAFRGLNVTGTLNGGATFHQCRLTTLAGLGSDTYPTVIHECTLKESTFTLKSGLTTPQSILFSDCRSGLAATTGTILDFNGADSLVGLRRHGGAVTLQNYTGGQDSVMEFSQGALVAEASCTTGSVEISGICSITNASTGTFTMGRRGHVGTSDDITQASFKSLEEVLFNALVAALNAGA